MAELSVFDIIGPAMIGPSSSHTAGALRIARLAHNLAGKKIEAVTFVLYGSFAHTYHGHGTDKALVGGILGFKPDNYRIRDSLAIADEQGLAFEFVADPDTKVDHPNTVDIRMQLEDGTTTTVRGESIGGGAAVITRINDVDIRFSGEHNTVFIRQVNRIGVLAHIAEVFEDHLTNISSANMYSAENGKMSYTVLETDERVPDDIIVELQKNPDIESAMVISADSAPRWIPDRYWAHNDDDKVDASGFTSGSPLNQPRSSSASDDYLEFDFTTGAELLAICNKHRISIPDVMRRREMYVTGDHSLVIEELMRDQLSVMEESIAHALEGVQHSMGGHLGGEALALQRLHDHGPALLGPIAAKAITYAMGVLETNASMGRIVATPTAGSSGILPGVIIAMRQEQKRSEQRCIDALFCAAAVGYLVARNGSVSGAQGGCQAEVGVASAMAAAAAVYLSGGSPEASLSAATTAMGNILGLVCDPIGGLVEDPCQKRNAMGAVNALASAEIALAGIPASIPFDEMVTVLDRVGRSLPYELRETALGGIAAAPSACRGCAGCS